MLLIIIIKIIRRLVTRAMSEYMTESEEWGSRQAGGWVMFNDGS